MYEDNRLIVLCKPADIGQLAMVQGVLESEDIDYHIENQEMSALHAGMLGLQPVVAVQSKDWEAANVAIETLIGYKR